MATPKLGGWLQRCGLQLVLPRRGAMRALWDAGDRDYSTARAAGCARCDCRSTDAERSLLRRAAASSCESEARRAWLGMELAAPRGGACAGSAAGCGLTVRATSCCCWSTCAGFKLAGASLAVGRRLGWAAPRRCRLISTGSNASMPLAWCAHADTDDCSQVRRARHTAQLAAWADAWRHDGRQRPPMTATRAALRNSRTDTAVLLLAAVMRAVSPALRLARPSSLVFLPRHSCLAYPQPRSCASPHTLGNNFEHLDRPKCEVRA
jgi:hypothetical protein